MAFYDLLIYSTVKYSTVQYSTVKYCTIATLASQRHKVLCVNPAAYITFFVIPLETAGIWTLDPCVGRWGILPLSHQAGVGLLMFWLCSVNTFISEHQKVQPQTWEGVPWGGKFQALRYHRDVTAVSSVITEEKNGYVGCWIYPVYLVACAC